MASTRRYGAWALLLAATTGLARAEEYAASVAKSPGLLAHYRFEDSQTPGADSSKNARNAEAADGATPLVQSAYASLGKAVRITDGGRLSVPDLGEHAAVSIEMWIKLNRPVAGGIGALYASDGWRPGFLHLNVKSHGGVELAVNGANSYPNTQPDTLVPGRWTHLVATYDGEGGVQRIFRDGRIIHEGPATPQRSVRLPKATVGAWMQDEPSRPIEADLDELAVYSRALEPGEVRNHYLIGKGVSLESVDFERQVLPIFREHCLDCHSGDSPEGGLRLDVRDWTFRGGESGEPAVAPYDSERSHLMHLVRGTGTGEIMPPDGTQLAAAKIKILETWIDQGAKWPDALAGQAPIEEVSTDHWSFQPIAPTAPPPSEHPFVRTGNEIDAFLYASMVENGLEPSPAADRRTLIRRLTMDMHGLPPTPEEVARFVNDDSPDAWERLVDRALASPRYGERWASHWLDVIRYGDTHGFEVNTPRPNAWPYRDYVIKSFNDDKPFDRFIVEQVAGDQIDAGVGTGFLVAAPALLPGQVGKDLPSMRLARSDELHEIVVTVSSGVLGLTVGCARCHNHKFDPVSQADYYRLQAVFAGTRYGERKLELEDSEANAAFAGTFAQPEPTFRLYRGDPMQRRERVAPDVPAVFGSLRLESTTPEAERRLALGKWLVGDDNPLTARVIVNRLWLHHFGAGIVRTPSDFGVMGTDPSHPELLDWLAAKLIADGWSLKNMHRRILTSNAFRQSSAPRDDAKPIDADSRLLWRFPPRRLEMEAIRDSVLFVAGSLDLTMGGPGFNLFKPNDNYVRVYEPKEEWGPPEWRRMIYAHRVRMEQDGVFGAFDCPDAGQPAPLRGRSTTAIQALNLFNSGFMLQQAESFAKRVEKEAGADLDAKIDRAFQLAFARNPSDAETTAAREVCEEYGLRSLCRALLNSNEFLFVP